MARRSVLLVEDDEALRSILARHLRARHYVVLEADSSEAARGLLESGSRPSAVVLDINLPGDTGWSLLRGRAYVEAGRPRVVVVSATRISSARLHEYAITGYLPKPFPIETLVATIERLISPVRSAPEA